MPFTTVAFFEDQDAGNAYVAVTAIADEHVTVNGDDLQVPELNQLVAIACGVGSGGDQLARLTSPSLRGLVRPHIVPLNGGNDGDVEPDSPQVVMDMRQNPLLLREDESLNLEIHSDTTAASKQWGILWLADGPISPVGGDIRTYRFTNTGTLTADVWSNGNLTADEDLAVGRYDVVGMRAVSAGLVAARLVPQRGGFRPGCLGCDDPQDIQHEMFRMGGLGVWLNFASNSIPSVDFLSESADTDQEVFLDLIRVSDSL